MSRARHLLLLTAFQAIGGAYWLPPRVRIMLYRWCGLEIGDHSMIALRVFIRPGDIRIGSGCFINAGCVLDPGAATISIGDKVAIGWHCVLAGNSHAIGPSQSRAGRWTSTDIRIGDGSWLGAGVIILPGVAIAPGCVIGAGSVVTKSTEPDGLYVGSPARLVRILPPELDAPERRNVVRLSGAQAPT